MQLRTLILAAALPSALGAMPQAPGASLQALKSALTPAVAVQANDASPRTEWSLERWTTANGLPQNSVTGIAQDRTGMLWLSTFGGLVQFDGLTMRTTSVATDPRLGSNRLLAIHASGDGTLYLGTEGHGVRTLRGRDLAVVDGAPGATSLSVMSFCAGRDGELWLATQRGVARLANGRIDFPWPAVTPWTHEVALGADGHIYCVAMNGLWRLGDDGPHHWAAGSLMTIAIDPAGNTFVGGTEGLWQLVGEQLVPFGPPRRAVADLTFDDSGHLLALDANGVHLMDRSGRGGSEWIDVGPAGRSLWRDRDRRIWVGHDGRGLTCCRRADLRACRIGHATLVTADPNGGYYYCIGGTIVHASMTGQASTLLEQSTEIFAMAPAGPETVWVGIDNTVYRLAATGALTTVAKLPQGQLITALAPSATGDLLVGTGKGTIARLRGGEVEVLHAPVSEWSSVHCFLETADQLWVGTAKGVLRSPDGGQTWRPLRAGIDIAAGEVRGIVEDRTGTVWIGSYGGGLTSCRGEATRVIGIPNGLPSDAICQLALDRERDELLINTNVGVCRSLLRELRAFAVSDAPATPFAVLTPPPDVGVEGNGFKWPSSCRLADGTWLFCSIDDVIALPPGGTAPPPQQLRASLAEVRFGSIHGDHRDADEQTRHAYFRFTAPAFESASFVVFRHRLRGFDAGWVLDGHAREVEYFDLPPGEYRFEVEATGPGSLWGPAATTSFVVPRSWLERPTTWCAIGALLLLGIVGIARFASRRQTFRNQLLEAAVTSRTTELQAEIARRREAEDRLRTAHEDLEHRVRERTAELRRAIAQLEDDARRREALEQQVDRLQRLDSIGRLAGGIAHDFNNLLTVVISSTELLRTLVGDAEMAGDLLDSLERAGHQGSRLTQQLLTFARRQSVRPEVIDLPELVRNSVQMLRRVVPGSIDFTLQIADQPISIEADRAQIEQVLVNLCVNARDAMPKGGTLTVDLALAPAVDGRPPRCCLRVIDTGIGMTQEVADRACEPFFSTKHRATNSGLGLSTCYGIVKRLDGDLQVQSAPGKGTTMTVLLPCTDKQPATAPVVVPRPQRLNGTALLIEDDDDVRMALAQVLTRQGCRVEDAPTGDHAVAMLDRGLRVDFVVSDLVMPGLQGEELVHALLQRRPNLPIVFVSGNPEAGGAPLRDLGYEVLEKPPAPAALVVSILRARRLAEAALHPTGRPAIDGAAAPGDGLRG